MYKLIYNIKIEEKVFKQEILMNSSYVIVFLNNKKIVYIKENDKSYSMDAEKLRLTLIDHSQIYTQNELMSKKIGLVSISREDCKESICGFPSTSYNYINGDNSFTSKIKTICIPDFELTAYNAYSNFNSKNQIVQIPISTNELLVYNKTEINFSGLKQIVETELIAIEKTELEGEFYKMNDYKIYNDERSFY